MPAHHEPSNGARDRQPRARNLKSDMLLAATRTFVQAQRPDRTTCDQFREAFYLLIGQADPQTRQKVATLLARAAFCPRPIALYLAMDAPAIAMPILRHSPVLGQLDMAQVVSKRGPVHARLLAARPQLPASVVTQMRALNDADLTAALATNRAVCGAERERTVAMRGLDKADAEAAREANRAARAGAETRPETGEAKPATDEAKPAMAEARPADARALEQRLMDALGATRVPQRSARPAPRPASRPAHRPMDAADFRTALETAALSRDRAAMAKAMRARLSLAHATAMQVLDDHSGNALLVLMKAEGFTPEMAHRIVLLALPAVGLSPVAAERVLQTWERLDAASCQAALAQWPRAEATRAVAQTDDAPGIRREPARASTTTSEGIAARRTG